MENQVSRRNKRYKAKRLFFTGKYTSRQIAAMVEVTEATMSKWVKRNGWKNPETAGPLPALTVFSIVSAGFVEYLEQNSPELLNELKTEMAAYVKSTSYSTKKNTAQKSKIKALFEQMELNEFARICIDKVDELSFQKATRLLAQMTEYNQPPIELLIKTVNP